MTINEITEKALEYAEKIGAYDCEECSGTGQEKIRGGLTISCEEMPSKKVLKELLRCMDCNGTGKTPEQNIINKLREEVAIKKNDQERALEFEACYHMQIEGNENSSELKEYWKCAFETCMKNTTGDKGATIIIWLLAYYRKLGVDIDSHIQARLRYNEIWDNHK